MSQSQPSAQQTFPLSHASDTEMIQQPLLVVPPHESMQLPVPDCVHGELDADLQHHPGMPLIPQP